MSKNLFIKPDWIKFLKKKQINLTFNDFFTQSKTSNKSEYILNYYRLFKSFNKLIDHLNENFDNEQIKENYNQLKELAENNLQLHVKIKRVDDFYQKYNLYSLKLDSKTHQKKNSNLDVLNKLADESLDYNSTDQNSIVKNLMNDGKSCNSSYGSVISENKLHIRSYAKLQ